ncbi:hypothetical protein COLO4_38589 [Corchorus olitorius]|uniref:Uncharacterized protein n=1 Tax=Corchorus olitorius TaxID=93759 RepID=A0A1R3FU89_9ROSI|nr:hypothetical protein COLO4_38589 [Corchorus olitorius]
MGDFVKSPPGTGFGPANPPLAPKSKGVNVESHYSEDTSLNHVVTKAGEVELVCCEADNQTQKLHVESNISIPCLSPLQSSMSMENGFLVDQTHETDSDSASALGSPCFSVHSRLILLLYEEVTSIEYGLLDNSNAPNYSPMELAIVPSLNDNDWDVASVLDDKKKKRVKHNWSRKKSHSKVANGTLSEDDNFISDEDIQFRNNLFRKEAVETFKIGQLLGLCLKDKDEDIINKLVELEYED